MKYFSQNFISVFFYHGINHKRVERFIKRCSMSWKQFDECHEICQILVFQCNQVLFLVDTDIEFDVRYISYIRPNINERIIFAKQNSIVE